MSDTLRRLGDHFGRLLGIVGACEFTEGAPHCDAWIFDFETGILVVEVNVETDEISVGSTPPNYPFERDLIAELGLEHLLGSTVPWVWMLTNQQGFHDGIQLEFRSTDQVFGLQLIAAASALAPFAVSKLV